MAIDAFTLFLLNRYINGTNGGTGTAGVTTFNNRTGTVMPQAGDYTADMVGADPAGTSNTALSEAKKYIDNKLLQTASMENLNKHTSNTDVHITESERTKWNGKQDAITGTAGQAVKIGGNGTPVAVTEEQPEIMWVTCKAEQSLESLAISEVSKKFEEIYNAIYEGKMVFMKADTGSGILYVLQATAADLSSAYFSLSIPSCHLSTSIQQISVSISSDNTATGNIWTIEATT